MAASWKLAEARARFSEVVRRAQSEGAQRISVRGLEAVAVISIVELDRLKSAAAPQPPLIEFLEGLQLHELNLERETDGGRDIAT